MTDENVAAGEGDGRSHRRRIVIAVATVGVAVAVTAGILAGLAVGRRGRPERAEAEAAGRIVAAYEDTLARLRETQGKVSDPETLADLVMKERELRVIAAAGLGGVIQRTRDAEFRKGLEAQVREMLSVFLDAGAIIQEIERPFFKKLSEEDPEFARDLNGLLEFLVREEQGALEAKRKELEELKAQEAEIRKGLAPGGGNGDGQKGHGQD